MKDVLPNLQSYKKLRQTEKKPCKLENTENSPMTTVRRMHKKRENEMTNIFLSPSNKKCLNCTYGSDQGPVI
jgi:hypothetical protein